MALKEYAEKNRAAWNQAIPRHKKAWGDSIIANLNQPNFVYLDEREVYLLKEFGIGGKRVAHICSNNGIETLSLIKIGAGSCVGFDISDEAVAEAIRISETVQIPVTYVRTDVYDIPSEYDGEFDFVFISGGTLGWMPDIDKFFGKVCGLLSENGIIFIHEMHPLIDAFGEKDRILKYSYFKDTPFVDSNSLDYIGKTDYESEPQYWFHHTMSCIIQALIDSGMMIAFFEESPEDISAVSAHLESRDVKLPLSYILVGRK